PVGQFTPRPEFIPTNIREVEVEPVPFDPAEWEDVGFSPLTWKVLGAKYDLALEEVPTWAYEMMQLGYDTPSLRVLAGISKPISYYYLQPYFEDTLKELAFPVLAKEDAEICYITFYMKQIANGITVKDLLWKLNQEYFNEAWEYFYSLYYLYNAWQDLDAGYSSSHYWPSATADNIELHCINEARYWLAEHYDLLQGIRRQLIGNRNK
ncbi:MAG: hypothetical protein ACTHKV_04770, partial [Flavipsychrobacter sp.]